MKQHVFNSEMSELSEEENVKNPMSELSGENAKISLHLIGLTRCTNKSEITQIVGLHQDDELSPPSTLEV